MKHSALAGVFAAAFLIAPPSQAIGQEDRDDFFVDHFTSANQIYTFVNAGALASASPFDAAAYACANIYVYSDQDPVACGSCFVSPNGSLEINLHTDLIGHPVTGVTPAAGVIKVVPTQFPVAIGMCDPLALGPSGNFLAEFRARGNSEIQLDGVILSPAERAKLQFDCSAIVDVLSGAFNVTCGTTDPPEAPVSNALAKQRPPLDHPKRNF